MGTSMSTWQTWCQNTPWLRPCYTVQRLLASPVISTLAVGVQTVASAKYWLPNDIRKLKFYLLTPYHSFFSGTVSVVIMEQLIWSHKADFQVEIIFKAENRNISSLSENKVVIIHLLTAIYQLKFYLCMFMYMYVPFGQIQNILKAISRLAFW